MEHKHQSGASRDATEDAGADQEREQEQLQDQDQNNGPNHAQRAQKLAALGTSCNLSTRKQLFVEVCALYTNQPRWDPNSSTRWKQLDNEIGDVALQEIDRAIEHCIREQAASKRHSEKAASTASAKPPMSTIPGADTIKALRSMERTE
jgi:hypothetical protein